MSDDVDEKSWLKEHLEHLRTVHFTLLVVSSALIVLVSRPTSTDIATAHQQIKDILETANSWNPRWLHDYASQMVTKSIYAKEAKRWPESPQVIGMKSQSGSENLPLDFLEPNWTEIDDPESPLLEHSDQRILGGGGVERWEPAVNLKRPSTLKEFRDIWTYLYGPRYVYIPLALDWNINLFDISTNENRAYAAQRNDGRTSRVIDVTWLFQDARYTPIGAKLALRTLGPQDRQVFAAMTGGTGACGPTLVYAGRFVLGPSTSSGAEMMIWPVVSCNQVPFEAQMPLISRFSDRWRQGKFEDVFEELDRLATQLRYPEVSLEALEKFVDFQERLAGGEVFEFAGIKFPADATATWGVIVILAVQLYFWLHLSELRRKHRTPVRSEVAWLGIYPSIAARYIFGISAFVIPVTAVWLLQQPLIRMESRSSWKIMQAGGTLILAGWFAILAWKSRPVIGKR